MSHAACDYCGLFYSGSGYSPNGKEHFCCYGCYLVQRIIGTQGDEGIAAWLLVRLGIGAFLAMNVMMISLILYADPVRDLGASTIRGLHWALLILSTPAIVILGGPFILGAARDLLKRRVSMDALILTGSIAAYTASTLHVVRGSGHIYYDTATMLLLIVTLGRLLEASAKNKTSQAIKAMMKLIPEQARILREGEEVDIPTSQVRAGDLMLIKPGESIAADGRIVCGECCVEEAAFTGEALPRSCSPGDNVFGGSTNCDGLIQVQATAVGADSLLARIQEVVRQAQQERAPVERLAERAASVSVPLIWLLALGAAAYWGFGRGDIERAGLSALAVLVVACPCALGIATPIATCLAIEKAASTGVLIRSGAVLERLSSIKRVFFDKTGTLTLNHLCVTRVRTASDEISEEEALCWAAAVESGSEHVAAAAIVEAARARAVQFETPTCLRVIPGQGVAGTVSMRGSTRKVTVGSLKMLTQNHAVPLALLRADSSELLTTTYVAWDGEVRAAISLSGAARAEAAKAIELLKAMGVEATVISGDRAGPTSELALELGIKHAFFECSPTEKAAAIRKARKAQGFGIAMVGDGINDAPALAEADVGIAIGGGTDLARESSDVTLLGDDLSRIPEILDLARRTHKIIRWNLGWAFGYNSVAVGLAFFGYVHPLIAASAMVTSSLFVIGNSMRVRCE